MGGEKSVGYCIPCTIWTRALVPDFAAHGSHLGDFRKSWGPGAHSQTLWFKWCGLTWTSELNELASSAKPWLSWAHPLSYLWLEAFGRPLVLGNVSCFIFKWSTWNNEALLSWELQCHLTYFPFFSPLKSSMLLLYIHFFTLANPVSYSNSYPYFFCIH